jgi:hypothetical protein
MILLFQDQTSARGCSLAWGGGENANRGYSSRIGEERFGNGLNRTLQSFDSIIVCDPHHCGGTNYIALRQDRIS